LASADVIVARVRKMVAHPITVFISASSVNSTGVNSRHRGLFRRCKSLCEKWVEQHWLGLDLRRRMQQRSLLARGCHERAQASGSIVLLRPRRERPRGRRAAEQRYELAASHAKLPAGNKAYQRAHSKTGLGFMHFSRVSGAAL
jgi:hypothetical protein